MNKHFFKTFKMACTTCFHKHLEINRQSYNDEGVTSVDALSLVAINMLTLAT
jgi:hypothetical protein